MKQIWLGEIDYNTKFFHTVTSHRRHKSKIYRLVDGDRILTRIKDYKDMLVYILQTFFGRSRHQINMPLWIQFSGKIKGGILTGQNKCI